MVNGTFAIASAVVFEADLSFLGLGAPPEIPTRGGRLAHGREYRVAMARILSRFRHEPARRRAGSD